MQKKKNKNFLKINIFLYIIILKLKHYDFLFKLILHKKNKIKFN